MKRVCITINLKYKVLRISNKKFEYFIEKHLDAQNFESLINKIFKDQIKFVYIEEICLLKLANLNEVLTFFKINKIEVIIIYIKKYQELNLNIKLIDIVNDNFDQKINEYEQKNDKIIKKEKSNEQFKFLDNTILALALDRKLYMTTYLINLVNTYNNKKVLFIEVKQSLIEYQELMDLKTSIDYKVIKHFKELKKINYQKYDKVIIDLGYVYNINYIQQLLNNLTLAILVFDTNCIKVMENPKYVQEIRLLEKYNNITFINREEIFDKILQETLDPLKSKIVKKHIKKYKLGGFKC
ncbi:MAG: hypothetical protein ACK5HR_02285 [Mycoplasmatales bacterium]